MAIKTAHLLDAAATQLARRPNSSLAQIAEAADVSRTTLFYRFSTRDELVDALAVDTLDVLRFTLMSLSWNVDDVDRTLRAVVTALMPIAERMQVVLRESPSNARPDMNESWEYAMAPLTTYLSQRQKSGQLRKDLPLTWLVESLTYLMFAAWDSVMTDSLTPELAAQFVSRTWLNGTVTVE